MNLARFAGLGLRSSLSSVRGTSFTIVAVSEQKRGVTDVSSDKCECMIVPNEFICAYNCLRDFKIRIHEALGC